MSEYDPNRVYYSVVETKFQKSYPLPQEGPPHPKGSPAAAEARRIMAPVSSLDDEVPLESCMLRKKQRCKYRIIDGFLESYWGGNQYFRFLTLTTANEYKGVLREDWEKLKKRIKRNTSKKFEYLRVKTDEGNGVIHCLFIGEYIAKDWIIQNWFEITGAFIVNIQLIRIWKRRGMNNIVRYLANNAVNQYMLKNIVKCKTRMSTSRAWISKKTRENKEEVKKYNRLKYINQIMMRENPADRVLTISTERHISKLFNQRWINYFKQLHTSNYPTAMWKIIDPDAYKPGRRRSN